MELRTDIQTPPGRDLAGASNRRPSVANAADTYREAPVHGSLAGFFVCRWRNQGSPPGVDAPLSNVVPDGCVDLILANGRLHVAGPDRVFQLERIAPGGIIAGMRFHPGHAAAWLGIPVSEIVNGRLPLGDLWGANASRIEDEIASAAISMASDLALERVLASWTPVSDVDRRWRAVPGLLLEAAARGEPVVPWLMSEFGLSERTLRRQVEAAFGYGPKTLDRILRFQRFLHMVRVGEGQPLARLAIEAGYADQAHLTRECSHLAGLTPGQLATDFRRGSDRSGSP